MDVKTAESQSQPSQSSESKKIDEAAALEAEVKITLIAILIFKQVLISVACNNPLYLMQFTVGCENRWNVNARLTGNFTTSRK